jgi:hypothetical protein
MSYKRAGLPRSARFCFWHRNRVDRVPACYWRVAAFSAGGDGDVDSPNLSVIADGVRGNRSGLPASIRVPLRECCWFGFLVDLPRASAAQAFSDEA